MLGEVGSLFLGLSEVNEIFIVYITKLTTGWRFRKANSSLRGRPEAIVNYRNAIG